MSNREEHTHLGVLSAEQIAILRAVLWRVSAATIAEEAKIRFGLTLGRAERRRVAAQIKNSKTDDLRGNLFLWIPIKEIELLSDLSRHSGKASAELFCMMLHRALADLVAGNIVSLRSEKLSAEVIEVYRRALAEMLPATPSCSTRSSRRKRATTRENEEDTNPVD